MVARTLRIAPASHGTKASSLGTARVEHAAWCMPSPKARTSGINHLALPLDRESGRFDTCDQRQAVLLVARDQRQLDANVGDLERDALAAVLDRDDVRALLGDRPQQLDQLARAI